MRIPRFYTPQPLPLGEVIELLPEVFHHAVQVLRLTVGEALILFNGQGGEYHATLHSINKRTASAKIEQFHALSTESPVALTLAQAIIKPDKMDIALQKAVELGVNAIQPLITQRSVVRLGKDQLDKKWQHWQGILIAACEQAGRTTIPQLHATLSLEQWLTTSFAGTRLLLVPGDYPRINALADNLLSPLAVTIGPEGGFSVEEVALCLQHGLQPIALGPRILRAETASIAALALLQQRYGDL